MSNMEHFKGFSLVDGDIKINVNLKRFENQISDAQFYLDSQIMNDMVPYMPMQTGTFINNTRARSAVYAGTGKVIAAASPYGRYLYMGKVMVNSKSGKGPRLIPGVGLRYPAGATLVATERDLTYSNPNATARWFNTAKQVHGTQWVDEVKKRAGGK